MKSKFTLSSAVALLLLPFITNAQSVNTGVVGTLFDSALSIINDYVVPLIFAVAFLLFLVRVFQLFIQGGANEESVQNGRKFVMWSMIGFFLMFSVWGLINLLIGTLGFGSSSMPNIPTFGPAGSTGGSGSSYYSGGSSGSLLGNTVPAGSGGVCTSGYTYNGNSCSANSTNSSSNTSSNSFGSSGGGQGNNTVSPGQSCQHSDDCAPINGSDSICASGVCQAQPSNTDAWGKTQPGQACSYDEQCSDSYVCSPTSHTCTGDQGADASGSGKGNSNVSAGGLCQYTDDCASGLTCESGTCQNIDTSNDSGDVGLGGACTRESQCSGNLTCQSGVCSDTGATSDTSGDSSSVDNSSSSGGEQGGFTGSGSDSTDCTDGSC